MSRDATPASGSRQASAGALLRWLGRRPRTEKEAEARLGEAGLPAAERAATLRRWRDLGYLDDRRLAYTYLSARAERRLQGRWRLAAELSRRGVPSVILDAVVPEAVDDEAERRHLERLLDRRLETDGLPEGPRARARLVRFLRRRGFEDVAIRRALDRRGARGPEDDLD